MAQTYEFYKARADEAKARAKDADLDRVREREERAAKSWKALADQARKTNLAREKADAERAAKREAEAAKVN